MSSDLVLLETLVKPLQDADTAVERLFRELFDADEVMLIPTTRQLWEEAARLRADEEVNLRARGVPLHGPDGIGVNGQTAASSPPGGPFGKLSPAPEAVDPQLRRPEKQGWNRSLGKGRLVNPAGPAN